MHRPVVQKKQANTPSKGNSVLPMLKDPLEAVTAKNSAEAQAGAGSVPSSMQDRFTKDADNLQMIRRLPAVLTGTLPTLESLGVQVNLPSGAELLSKAPPCCTQCKLGPCLVKMQLRDVYIFNGL